MLSILIVSDSEEGYDIGAKLKNEGNIVKFYSTDRIKREWNQHSPQVVESFKPHISSADLILNLSAQIGGDVETLAEGRRVWGWGVVDGLLKEKKKDLLRLLRLEEVTEGVQLTIGGFYSKGEIRFPYVVLHSDRFMEGNKGVRVNRMGCVAFYLPEDHNFKNTLQDVGRLFDGINFSSLLELDITLQYNRYMITDINVSNRNGCLQALTEGIRFPLGRLLYHLSLFDSSLLIEPTTSILMALGLSVPPWPFSLSKVDKTQVLDVTPSAFKHTWLSYDESFLGYITARGEDLIEARRRIFRTVRNIVRDDVVQYRRDIGYGLDKTEKLLKEWDYLPKEVSNAA